MDSSLAGSRLLFDNGRGDPPPPAAPRPVSAAPPTGLRTAASPIGLMMAGGSKMFLVQPDRQFFPPQPVLQVAERMAHGACASSSGQENRVGFQQWHAACGGGGGGGNLVRNGDAAGTDEDNNEDCDDDDSQDDDDDEDGDGEVEGTGPTGNSAREERLNSSTTAQSSSEKVCHDKANSQEDQSSFGSSRGGLDKDGGTDNCQGDGMSRQEPHHQRRMVRYENNAITITEPEVYYAQILQEGGNVPSLSQKEAGGQGDGCGFSGRKDGFFSSNALGDSLRKHLSDPITGVLMDDAMILPCGHSYGSSGMQHVVRMKACSKCDQPFPDNSFRPNLALRSAVQAFRREEEILYSKSSKRRRERFEQDKCNFNEFLCVDPSGKGVQFPFAISDRVIIKGNKRTPPRFVGRLAIVTGQCLNGWYVVKALDNAESVKLQYRSLAKAPDDAACTVMATQATAPTWL